MSKDKDKKVEDLEKKMSGQEFTEKLMTDYEFARRELSEAGLKIDQELHNEIRKSYEELNNSARKVADSWQGPTTTGRPNITVFVGVKGTY